MDQTTITAAKIRQAEKRVEAARGLKRSLYMNGWNNVSPSKNGAAAERKRRERVARLIDDIIEEMEDMHRLAVMMADPPAWLTSPAPRAGGVIIEKAAA